MPEHPNSAIEFTKPIKPNDTITISCNEGYKLDASLHNNRMFTCLRGSRFQPAFKDCIAKDCQIGVIENSNIKENLVVKPGMIF